MLFVEGSKKQPLLMLFTEIVQVLNISVTVITPTLQ